MKEIASYAPKTFLERQGSDLDSLETRMNEVNNAFIQLLDSLETEKLHQPIQEAKWTPAEIADHLIRTHKVFVKAITDAIEGKDLLIMPKGFLSAEGKPMAQ